MLRQTLIVLALASVALAADLNAIRDSAGSKLWRDRGGTSGRDLTVYEPVRSGSDYYILGQRAQANYNKMERQIHSFKDNSNRRDALRRADGFRFIWDDRGSTYYDDASVWRPLCPRGYEALGDMLARKNRVSSPPSELFDKFRCVVSRLTEYCDFGSKIWSNSGTSGKYYISMWDARPRNTHFSTSFYYARNQHNERPDTNARCLKRAAVRVL